MPSNDSSNLELYRALEKYLASALEVLSGWGEWLAEHERRVLESNIGSLQAHAVEAQGLHSDLKDLSERRTEVLGRARAAGFTCSTLKQLAQSLPQWHTEPELRQRVKNVENCTVSLRRLNTAAWLLVNQCSRVVDETLMLMTTGSTLRGAYIDAPHADNYGGQILDTEA